MLGLFIGLRMERFHEAPRLPTSVRPHMSRRLIGCRPMTPAERQLRYRQLHPYGMANAKFKSRLKRWGLTPWSFFALVEKQSGGCAICGRKPVPEATNQKDHILHIDHCHDCQKLRGLLCNRCNRALGMFGDKVAVLQRAIDYLSKHKCDSETTKNELFKAS